VWGGSENGKWLLKCVRFLLRVKKTLKLGIGNGCVTVNILKTTELSILMW
jgi:hypothetical protein